MFTKITPAHIVARLITLTSVVVMTAVIALPAATFAVVAPEPTGSSSGSLSPSPAAGAGCDGGVTNCSGTVNGCDLNDNSDQCNIVKKYVNPFITFLTALVGISVTIGIIAGGIQYASSAGDPQKAAAAKGRIWKAIIALIVFLFLYAMLKFLLPYGVLTG